MANKTYTDHLGNTYPTFRALAQAYNINPNTLYNRLERGCDLETALTGRLRAGKCKTCKDHLGKEFASIEDMVCDWGIPREIFRSRVRAKWSLEQALTTPPTSKTTVCTDHLGTQYETVQDMMQTYHISKGLYYHRINMGWPIEEVLLRPAKSDLFAGFDIKHITRNAKHSWYQCKCQLCGLEDIMTLPEMLTHQRTHEGKK